ncbi:MAG: hypothetical protein HC888_04095 [Candidatus Competibacteraceae bacterium]|nr:hypothetical protein [Candidatus Competibacteraceae bacterium]
MIRTPFYTVLSPDHFNTSQPSAVMVPDGLTVYLTLEEAQEVRRLSDQYKVIGEMWEVAMIDLSRREDNSLYISTTVDVFPRAAVDSVPNRYDLYYLQLTRDYSTDHEVRRYSRGTMVMTLGTHSIAARSKLTDLMYRQVTADPKDKTSPIWICRVVGGLEHEIISVHVDDLVSVTKRIVR